MPGRSSLGVVNNSNNGTPGSYAGAVYWPAFSVVYSGITYTVNAGWTTNKYVWWAYNGGSPSSALTVSDTFPTLVPEDWLVIVNTYGLGVDLTIDNTGIFAQAIVPGTIQAGALAANSIVAANIVAGTITGAQIAANTISAKNLAITDPTNYCSNPNMANNALDWNALGSSGMVQVYATPNLIDYTPKTWSEWTLTGTGSTKGSGGIHLVQATSIEGASVTVNVKPSTKYGFLYNVKACTLDNLFCTNDSIFTNGSALGKTVGNNKTTLTSLSTVVAGNNTFKLVCNSLNTDGKYIDFTDIRMYELPVGSQIESDFANLTADQLILLYPLMTNGAPTGTVGRFNTQDNYCGAYVTVVPGDQYYFEVNAATPDSLYALSVGMVFFDKNIGFISKNIGAQLNPTAHWTNKPWTTTITASSIAGATTLTLSSAVEIIPLAINAKPNYTAQGTVLTIGSETSTITAVNGNVVTLQTPLVNAYTNGASVSLVTSTSGFVTVPANAVYGFVWTNINNTSNFGNWYLTNLTVMKMYGGNLIVDGTITGNNIAANTITATNIKAQAITVNELASTVGANLNISSNSSITNKVTSQGMTDAINAIKLGARNLLVRSSLTSLTDIAQNSKSGYGVKFSIGDNGSTAKVWNNLSLKPNTDYTLTFIAWTSANTKTINIDLYPDTLPEKTFDITPTATEYTWTLNSANASMSACSLRFFRASYVFVEDMYFTDIKLEEGNKATDWTPSPEEIQEQLNSGAETINLINTGLGNRISTAEGSITTLSSQIASKVSQSDYDLVAGTVSTHTSQIEQNASAITTSVASLQGQINTATGKVDEVRNYMTFDANGLTFRKDGSNFKITIDNDSMDFFDGAQKVAYITGQTFYITKGDIVSELSVASHKMTKYNSDITTITWEG